MLVAITAILAIFCTFRIGDAIKIPLKFISVFVASALFGPWLGGLCGALGDLINVFLVPSGAPLPLLTVLEFFVGFVYGVFFYNRTQNSKSYIFRCILCAVIIFLSDIFLSTAVLLGAGYFPDFMSAIIIRLPAGIIKAIIQLVFFMSYTTTVCNKYYHIFVGIISRIKLKIAVNVYVSGNYFAVCGIRPARKRVSRDFRNVGENYLFIGFVLCR